MLKLVQYNACLRWLGFVPGVSAFMCSQVADIVAQRAEEGKNYGIVLIPEGLIEHIPQVRMAQGPSSSWLAGVRWHLPASTLLVGTVRRCLTDKDGRQRTHVYAQIGALISELNDLLADVTTDVDSQDAVMTRLSSASLAVFEFLPGSTRQQLLLDRDPHGNVQVPQLP